MKVVSLFAGIGGFDLALTRHGHEIVYVNEWDKYAAKVYENQFGHRPDTRSITDVPTGDIPDHDLVCGGFPCQAFSVAGKRGGFNDTRGTLFFDVARILKDKRPRYFILENVKGLLSHENGKTIQTIFGVLTDIGYEFQWQVLNSKDFGVPQNRERIFIVGHLRGQSRPEVFPLRQNSESDYVLPTITTRYYEAQANGGYTSNKPKQIIGGSQGNRVYDPSGTSTTIASQAGGLGAKTGLYLTNLKSDILQGVSEQRAFSIRRLTPIECERLQGFPDNWTAGVSDTQRYKQLGNAVTVNVVEAIIKQF